MKSNARGAGVAAALFAIGAFASVGSARADQAPVEPSREQLTPSAQAPAPRARSRASLLRRLTSTPCPIGADTSVRFTLEGVTVDGARVEGGLWRDFVGKSVSGADLCRIQSRIEDFLYDQGFGLARVYIPKQTIKAGETGTVRFDVVQGRISVVNVHGDLGPVQAKVEAILRHLQGPGPFNRFAAERYLALAADVPGVQIMGATLSRAPEAGPEAFDLDVTVTRAAVDEEGEVSNLNAKTQGPWSGIARLDLNSFTPLGERTSLIVSPTLGNDSQDVVQVLEEIRLGSNGIFARGSFSYGYSHPGDVLTPLDLRGNSYVGTLEIDDPIIRSRDKNLFLSGGFDIVNQRTNFPGDVALSNDALRVLWIKANADSSVPLAGSLWDSQWTLRDFLSLEVRKGFHILGASDNGAIALSRPQGQSDAWVVRADGGASISAAPLGRGLPISLSTHFQGQWADRPLLVYEEQSIGNLTIGRGYDPASATGDRAFTDEFKAAFGPVKIVRNFDITPYGFYDIARVGSLSEGVQDVWLRSLGGGLEINLPHRAHIDIFYAKPLDRPFPGEPAKPNGRVFFQLTIVH